MRQKRVIIFEDEDYLLTLYRDIFLMQGFEVLAFHQPEICPIYRFHNPLCTYMHPCTDIMITDFQMPGVNGLELLEAQAKRGCKVDIRNKALISGFIDEDKIARLDALGCQYFHKPLNIASLLDWVDECSTRIDLSMPLAMQRKELRSPGAPGTRCEVSWDSGRATCRALNVSSTGCCLEIPVPLHPEQRVRIDAVPTSFQDALVRWVSRTSEGTYLAGFCSR